jgi:hypothetical protein
MCIYHLQGSLFKEKQSLQSKSGDNIKCLHKYYNWLMYRFSRERFHPHDTKCMSDEMYFGLQRKKNVQTNKFLGPIENKLVQTPKPAKSRTSIGRAQLEQKTGTGRTQSHILVPD